MSADPATTPAVIPAVPAADEPALGLLAHLGQAIAEDPLASLLWIGCLILGLLALATLTLLVVGWAA